MNRECIESRASRLRRRVCRMQGPGSRDARKFRALIAAFRRKARAAMSACVLRAPERVIKSQGESEAFIGLHYTMRV